MMTQTKRGCKQRNESLVRRAAFYAGLCDIPPRCAVFAQNGGAIEKLGLFRSFVDNSHHLHLFAPFGREIHLELMFVGADERRD